MPGEYFSYSNQPQFSTGFLPAGYNAQPLPQQQQQLGGYEYTPVGPQIGGYEYAPQQQQYGGFGGYNAPIQQQQQQLLPAPGAPQNAYQNIPYGYQQDNQQVNYYQQVERKGRNKRYDSNNSPDESIHLVQRRKSNSMFFTATTNKGIKKK
jgi:hypothetical protein